MGGDVASASGSDYKSVVIMMIGGLGDIPWIPVFIPGSSKTRIPVKDLEIYVLQGCCCVMSELDTGNSG